MIIGRRGAGKTDALLSTPLSDDFHHLIYFNSKEAAQSFTTILDEVEATIQETGNPPLVELVADLWDNLFWIAAIARMKHDMDAQPQLGSEDLEGAVITDFIEAFGFEPDDMLSPYKAVLCAVSTIRRTYKTSEYHNQDISLFRALPGLRFGPYRISEVKIAALNWLANHARRALILFDSFEDLDIARSSNRHAISGLLKSIGDFDRPGAPMSIRACIPAEVFFHLTDISSNVLKDFQRSMLLHWSAYELLKLAAKRYQIFMEAYYFRQAERLELSHDLNSRTDVMSFWTSLFPESVINRVSGQAERPLPYILRHTQLLPRQILLILNRILSAHLMKTGDPLAPVAPDIVVDQMRGAEALLVSQALAPFKAIWPDARRALTEVLPHIGSNIIHYGEMHKVYNKAPPIDSVSSFRDFIRMLIEIGVAGRLVRDRGEYAVAAFEYNEAHRLVLTDKDSVCIHPLYSSEFRVSVEGSAPRSYRPIYPLGADPEDADRRLPLMMRYRYS